MPFCWKQKYVEFTEEGTRTTPRDLEIDALCHYYSMGCILLQKQVPVVDALIYIHKG